MQINTHEDYHHVYDEYIVLERALKAVPEEDISQRNDILYTLDSLGRAIGEYMALFEKKPPYMRW